MISYIAVCGELSGQLYLSGPSPGQQLAVSGQCLEGVDTVIQGSLDIVHYTTGAAPHNNGGHTTLLLVCIKYDIQGHLDNQYS